MAENLIGFLSRLALPWKQAQTPPAPGLLPVLTAEQLLVQDPRPLLLRQIYRLLSFPTTQLETLFRSAISKYAGFVQQLPASEAHHHAGAGGMLDHGLEVVTNALTIRRSYLLPNGATPERLAQAQDLWTYAVFSAALLHDIGKPVVDQHITLFDNDICPLGAWDPWQGPMDERAVWYRVDFARERLHGFHETVAPLLCRLILPPVGVSWLASDPEVLTSWIAAISGDKNESGVLGEIILNADRASVASNLGAGGRIQLPTARATPLHEKLLIGLRYLLDEGALPLNTNGAAGWIYGDDLWLVVKRCLDELRAHLQSEGQTGIPSRNDRLMDELQQNGILIANADKAVWKMRVLAPDWPKAHELTMLRFPVHKIWPNPDARPQAFAGTITPIRNQEPGSDSVQNNLQPKATGIDTSHILGSNRSEDDQKPMNKELVIKPSPTPVNANSHTGSSNANLRDQPARQSEEPHEQPEIDAGMQFLTWLREGLISGRLVINTVSARVHVVKEGLLLISPGIFKDYDLEQWAHVQKRFQKLKLNLRTTSGENIHTYVAWGKRKRSLVKGFLISEPGKMLPSFKLPRPNPHLSLLK